MEKLNAAVIGVGSMGKNHARNYFDMKETDLVAVSDVNEKSAKTIAERFSCSHYADYKKMLSSEDIDIISVVVPTNYHEKVAIDCMRVGKHILIEKPISDKVASAKKIIEESQKNKTKLMVGHIERFNPAVTELKKRLDNNELGRIFNINVQRVGPFPARIRDVGVVIDLATHDIDIIRHITGSSVQRVYAEAEKKIHTKHEDMLSGLVKFKNGILGVLSVNWLTPEKIREISVVGEKGMFFAKYLTQELLFYENVDAKRDEYSYSDILMGVTEGDVTSIRIRKQEPLRVELKAFVDCVVNNKKPPITGQDGLRALEIAKLMIESSKKNKVIRV